MRIFAILKYTKKEVHKNQQNVLRIWLFHELFHRKKDYIGWFPRKVKSGKKYQEDSNMVWEAAEHGDIPVDRFCSYRKLMNENRYLENSQAYPAEKK